LEKITFSKQEKDTDNDVCISAY